MSEIDRGNSLSPRRAAGELVFAGALWGFGFIATRWALLGIGPLWITTLRFLIAFGLSSLFIKRSKTLRPFATGQQFFLALLPGLFLSASLLLQTYGLRYTTVTRSGFITVLYIVFVPILDRVWFKTRLHWWHAFYVALALVGAGLICRVEYGGWNRGDLLTLGCAIVGAFHILSLEKAGPKVGSAIVFNAYQAFWAGLIPTLFALLFEKPPEFPLPVLTFAGMFMLTVASTLVAFMIQIRSQRVLPASIVSMLFLLESPFAALFGFLFFKEEMMPVQWLGAGLILFSAIGAVRSHIGLKIAETPVAPGQ